MALRMLGSIDWMEIRMAAKNRGPRLPMYGAGAEEPNTVAHPAHYTQHPSGIECITISEHFCFNLGNVIKYIWRADLKGAEIEDLEKALWYLQREINKRKTGG